MEESNAVTFATKTSKPAFIERMCIMFVLRTCEAVTNELREQWFSMLHWFDGLNMASRESSEDFLFLVVMTKNLICSHFG